MSHQRSCISRKPGRGSKVAIQVRSKHRTDVACVVYGPDCVLGVCDLDVRVALIARLQEQRRKVAVSRVWRCRADVDGRRASAQDTIVTHEPSMQSKARRFD